MKSFSADRWKLVMTMFLIGILQICNAQNGGTADSGISNHHSKWYIAPWIWAVGGVVIILLLITVWSGRRSASSRTSATLDSTPSVNTEPEELS